MIDLFDYPDRKTWETRRKWLDTEIDKAHIGLSYVTGSHSTNLFMDMQIAFCSGAWISVIVLAISVVDSHFRETEALDPDIGTAKLLSDHYRGAEINWLRRLRNKYVHLDVNNPILEVNDWFDIQDKFELDATKAMEITIRALFQNNLDV